ncbi:hypothetical protein RUM43_002383, partial [Polyplax serrata]
MAFWGDHKFKYLESEEEETRTLVPEGRPKNSGRETNERTIVKRNSEKQPEV